MQMTCFDTEVSVQCGAVQCSAVQYSTVQKDVSPFLEMVAMRQVVRDQDQDHAED
jgi:hypothetical protein